MWLVIVVLLAFLSLYGRRLMIGRFCTTLFCYWQRAPTRDRLGDGLGDNVPEKADINSAWALHGRTERGLKRLEFGCLITTKMMMTLLWTMKQHIG